MAFNAATEWDVRTTGNAANGGGFQVGIAGGTDFSQQDAAEHAYTDLVIDGTTNTKITSGVRPFTDADKGNIINVTAGTGFTVQRIQIVSVAANVATCDKAVGTLSSTGGMGNLGGALASPVTAAALVVSGNWIHVKAGTYVLTASATLAAGVRMVGYQSAHLDFGTPPVITTATDSTRLILCNGAGAYFLANMSLSNTATVRAIGVDSLRGDIPGTFYHMTFDGFTSAIGRTGGGWVPYLRLDEVEVKNSTGVGVLNAAALYVINSNIHDNASHGIQIAQNSASPVYLTRSVFADNGGDGFYQINSDVSLQQYWVYNCTFANNAGDGLQTGAGAGGLTAPLTVAIANNIFYGNGAYGLNNPVAPKIAVTNRANAYGANGTAAVLNMPAGVGDVTLTADPFTNAAGGDYSLNSTAGGGAACKAAGYQVA